MAATSIAAASGIVLEPLTNDNYDNWSTLVRNYLLGQDLWQMVTFVPTMDVQSKRECEIWARKNAKALHIIQLACGSESLTHIREFKTAKEAWNKLRALYNSKLKVDLDIEQGVVDDSLRHNKLLHRFVLNGEWNDARLFINNDKNAIYSTPTSGRTVLHLAVIAGHENIVEELVRLGKDKLVKMPDECGYTALHLAAKLSDNTKIAELLIEPSEADNISGIIDILSDIRDSSIFRIELIRRRIMGVKIKDNDQDLLSGKSGEDVEITGQDLLRMKTTDGEIPVLLAAAKAHKRMTRYLYSKTPFEELVYDNFRNGVLLLTRCITAEIFDVALKLLQRIPKLPLAHGSRDLPQPLCALTLMDSAFKSGSGFRRRQQLIYKILRLDLEIPQKKVQETTGRKSLPGRICRWVLHFPPVKLTGRLLLFVHMVVQKSILLNLPGVWEIYDKKMTHHLAHEILTCLYLRIRDFDESQLKEASAYEAMLEAAKHGIIEFIDVMSKANPNLLWVTDENKRGIFSHAIMNRRKAVFRLMNGAKVNGRKDIIKSRTDVFDNTLLHLAAFLGPSSNLSRRSGPALQMQREYQWFKAVESIVHPKCKEARNADNKKPREIFTESHKQLVKDGEKWAKETAGHYTLVSTLITTIMFAAAFTVPGGNNQESGVPLFLHDVIFSIFMIADAISLFTSSTSVLIFTGILTSRYAEKDFLHSLPWKLLFGLLFLFLSVISMIVVFCASLAMLLKGHQRIIIAAVSFGVVPLVTLMPSQLRLFREIFMSTILPKLT